MLHQCLDSVSQYIRLAQGSVFDLGTCDLPNRFDVFDLLQRSHDLWRVFKHVGLHGRGAPVASLHCWTQLGYFLGAAEFVLLAALLMAQLQGYLPMRPGQDWYNLMQSAICIVVLEITQIILVFVYDSANSQNLAVLRRKNLRLEKLSSALLTADSHKDKFLAMVSHDMRTPLNAVIGYSTAHNTLQRIC